MKELLIRTASGISFVGIVIGAIWVHPLSLLFLLSLILVLGLNEFYNLCYKSGYHPLKFLGILVSLAFLIFNFYVIAGVIPYKYLTLNLLIFVLAAIGIVFYSPRSLLQTLATTLTGVVYIALPLVLILFIAWNYGSYDPVILSSIFAIIWTYDSLAYLSGKLAGRTKMAAHISPSKSWEGFGGGIILTLFLVWLLRDLPFLNEEIPWLFFSFLIILSATLGDMFESALKRIAGVKDSGSLIPGHGGILDRFDSLFFATPIIFVFLYILN